MRTPSVSFLVTLISIQLPRSGMMRQECRSLSASRVDDEVDAGRAVQLADDDALGAVDDELAAADHDRHVAEVDFFLDGGAVGLAQAQPDAERPAVGEAELPALVRVVARLAEFVLDVLERDLLVVALDGEDFLQHAFEAGDGALVVGHVELQEAVVGPGLDVGQVGHVDGVAEAAEVARGRWGR